MLTARALSRLSAKRLPQHPWRLKRYQHRKASEKNLLHFTKLRRTLKVRSWNHACGTKYFDQVFTTCNKNIEGVEIRSYRPVFSQDPLRYLL